VKHGAVQQRDAADEGRLEPCGSTIFGEQSHRERAAVVRPSQLIASVRRTFGGIMRRRWTLVAMVGITAVVGGAAYWYHRWQQGLAAALTDGIIHQLNTAHDVAPVNAGTWQQLRLGMTKAEVTQLLGEAPRRAGPTLVRTVADGREQVLPEFWEYGFVAPFAAPDPDPRAHVVYFGQDGKVISITTPLKARPGTR
jgi:hypothetical protein